MILSKDVCIELGTDHDEIDVEMETDIEIDLEIERKKERKIDR